MTRRNGVRHLMGPASLRLQWPIRTGLIAGFASLLHLASGEWPEQMTVFAIPSFAAVTVTICSAQHLGGTAHHCVQAAAGIALGSLLAAATLSFSGSSDGGILGIMLLQGFIILTPSGELRRSAPCSSDQNVMDVSVWGIIILLI